MLEGMFVEIFSAIEDPRVERTKKHLLLDVIGLAIFAVIAGAQGFVEIEDFCKIHKDWIKQYFQLPNGIPSHDTFARVFSLIKPETFEECFLRWVTKLVELLSGGVIAIDGKTLRATRSEKNKTKALHIVSAWSCLNGFSLGQVKVSDKSNEITAIPELLKKICVAGAIVTIDAMGCQRAIAQEIIDQKADYILAVKENQGSLYDALVTTFAQAQTNNYQAMTVFKAEEEANNDHGRIEKRQVVVLPLMYLFGMKLKWRGLKSLILLISERDINDEKTVELRYYISSIDPKRATLLLRSIRQHWGIENNLHWSLDVTFREDQSRIRDVNSALNMAWLRKMALGLLKRCETIKGSIRRKQLAVWAKPGYLMDIVKI